MNYTLTRRSLHVALAPADTLQGYLLKYQNRPAGDWDVVSERIDETRG